MYAWRLMAVVVLVVPLLAGCGATPAPTVVPTTPPMVPTATAEPAGPKDGGVLRVAWNVNPADLTPGKNAQWAPVLFFEHIYDTLLRLDENGDFQPALALSYEVLPDYKTVIFKLRQGVQFHHGREFDAEDVKFTFERLVDPDFGSPWANLFEPIDKVEATDKYTVKFTLKSPFAPFLTYCATNWFTAIVPRDFAPTHNLNQEASGTGPFMLKEYVQDNNVTLVKNPNYWEKGMPHLDGIEFKIMPDVQTQIAALRTGELDLITVEDPKLLSTIQNLPGIAMMPSLDPVNEGAIGVNCAEGPTADVRVRRALSMGMDRQALIDTVLFGYGMVGTKISCGKKPYGYCGDGSDLPYYPYDPEGAKRLLAEAGYANGLELTIKVCSNIPITVQTAELLQDQWKKIGVNLKIEQMADFNLLLDDFIKVNHQLAMIWTVWQPDPDSDVYQIYYSTSTINLGKFKDTKLDALMDQARAEMNVDKRIKLYRDVETLVADQVYILYPWTKPVNWQFAQEYVKDYTVMPSGGFQYFREVWLDK
jgi:peptide/nickel transport system substrate-binding protein